MTGEDYRRIEDYLSLAEHVALARGALQTEKGREIRDEIRALLRKVATERIRAETREEGEPRDAR